jgi:hypothetical protein
MSTRRTLRTSWGRAALLVALPVVAAAAHYPAASTADAAAAAASATADAQVRQAIDSGPTAVRKLVHASADDYALATAILKKATMSTTTTGAVASRSPASVSASAAESCHGPVTSKTTVRIAGIDLGWRKAIVNQWCWNSSRITSSSVDHDEWSGFGYCWKEESQTNTWLVHPTRLNYRNKGTLTGVAPWGCSGGQQTISPSVHYERGGGYNVYAND